LSARPRDGEQSSGELEVKKGNDDYLYFKIHANVQKESPLHITTSKLLIRFSFLNVPKKPGEGIKKLTAVFCGKKKTLFSISCL
jgi:hypothetical protein